MIDAAAAASGRHGDATLAPSTLFWVVMDDETLLRSIARDLDGWFETLVREHQDRVFTIAFRLLGDAADAEEVAQDTFVRAYQALASYEARRIRELHLRAWLATIALNLCRNRAARRRPRTVSLSAPNDEGREMDHLLPPAPAAENPPERAARREGAERLAGLVADLPERYRAAVVLRHVDGMSYTEMSEVLGRPEGTIKAQVHRGLALLRAAFEAAEREESIA
jgi:RNA polymerase sigma-70 factor, ECF subfamily